jgi:hypothetical protein
MGGSAKGLVAGAATPGTGSKLGIMPYGFWRGKKGATTTITWSTVSTQKTRLATCVRVRAHAVHSGSVAADTGEAGHVQHGEPGAAYKLIASRCMPTDLCGWEGRG